MQGWRLMDDLTQPSHLRKVPSAASGNVQVPWSRQGCSMHETPHPACVDCYPRTLAKSNEVDRGLEGRYSGRLPARPLPPTAEEIDLLASTVEGRVLYWPSKCPSCGHRRFRLQRTVEVPRGQRYVRGAPIQTENESVWLQCTRCDTDVVPTGVVE